MAFVAEGITVDMLAEKIFEQKVEIERLRAALQRIARGEANEIKIAREALTAAKGS
jgi:hypothetical protein